MIYKLRQDIMRKLVPHSVEDEGKRELLDNILNCRKTDMGFIYSCIEATNLTGEDIVDMVKTYDADAKAKRDEAQQFAE